MKASVVVRSRDEAPRLRLVLASLARQSAPAEIVVVDDGSTDATQDVLAEARGSLDIVGVVHATAQGRSAAANAGARVANGDLLVFLDGDTLAGPEMVAAHLAAHAAPGTWVGRGETWHLRGTRTLQDPDAGTPWPGAPALPADELSRACVTRAQVLDDFAAIARRASPGVYPGAAPRLLHACEMAALRDRPDDPLLWAAASGSNLSVRRDAFLAAGGFDPALDINEHRELALRLCQRGGGMVPVDARTYHLIHRSGWRDPLTDHAWEAAFRRAHPGAPLDAMKHFWRSLSDGSGVRWIEPADAG
jgi:glycosyltransferase involved in cell wall biosynthesis